MRRWRGVKKFQTWYIHDTKKHKVGMKNALNISFRTLLVLKKWMKNICCLTHRFLTSTSWGQKKKKKKMVAFWIPWGILPPSPKMLKDFKFGLFVKIIFQILVQVEVAPTNFAVIWDWYCVCTSNLHFYLLLHDCTWRIHGLNGIFTYMTTP